ncbi:MAG: hypothetical protein DHS20C18_43850 [Saprospiraceae bacterium]|nr:MAG: hypothetical protein DHS20C18_43850 [Saprospiraceae bacterium]
MKAITIILCIAAITFSCNQSPKKSVGENQKVVQAEKKAYTGDSLVIQSDGATRLVVAPDALEKVKNLKPNAQNESNEPIVVKGVNMGPTINMTMVGKAQFVFNQNCSSCHVLGKSQGDLIGLAGITHKHDPAWIMNMTTGAPIELDKDPAKVARLQKCPTRQAGTRLSIERARDFVELVRNMDAG